MRAQARYIWTAWALTLPLVTLGLPRSDLVTRRPSPSHMRPINSKAFDYRNGLSTRASEEFSDLDPKTQAQLIYGSPGGM